MLTVPTPWAHITARAKLGSMETDVLANINERKAGADTSDGYTSCMETEGSYTCKLKQPS